MAFKTVLQRVRFETIGWTGPEMAQASDGFIKNGLLERIGRAQTVYDMPAPPLKPGYSQWKVRRGGLPIRDWKRTGRTLRSMKTLRAGPNTALIGFTDAVTNMRAFINNRVARQFGVSPNDRQVLGREFGKLPSPIKVVKTGSGKA